MTTPTVRLISTGPNAHQRIADKPCRHHRHVGCCPHCQRAQLDRWAAQLANVTSRSN
jgi:hypothetical protein